MRIENWRSSNWKYMPEQHKTDWKIFSALLILSWITWMRTAEVQLAYAAISAFTLISIGQLIFSLKASATRRTWYKYSRFANPAFLASCALFPLVKFGGVLAEIREFPGMLVIGTSILAGLVSLVNLLFVFTEETDKLETRNDPTSDHRNLQERAAEQLGQLKQSFEDFGTRASESVVEFEKLRQDADKAINRRSEQLELLLIEVNKEIRNLELTEAAGRVEKKNLLDLIDAAYGKHEENQKRKRPWEFLVAFFLGVATSLVADQIGPIVALLLGNAPD